MKTNPETAQYGLEIIFNTCIKLFKTVSKQALVQNLSNENELDLHENEHATE